MKTLIFIFLSALGLVSSFATDHCVRASAGGSNDGSDWNNAYTALPGTLVRGDTYYVADGTYAAYTFSNVSGTSTITIKYPTPAVHGPSGGWSDSYSSTFALWTRSTAGITWDFRLSNLVIDGNIDGTTDPITLRDKTRRRGFVIDNTAVTGSSSNYTIYNQNGTNANSVTVKNCEIRSVHGLGAEGGSMKFNQASTATGTVLVQYCFFNGGDQLWVNFQKIPNVTLEYNWFKNIGSGSASFHSAGIIVGATSAINFVVRYNVIENLLPNTGASAYIEPQLTGGSLLYIYGNVFWATDATEDAPNGVVALTASDSWDGMYFYNNTIYGLHNRSGFQVNGNQTNWVAQNNIWQGNTNAPLMTGVTDTTNIKNTGGVSFIDAATGNFRLSADTATTWTSLSTPYNVDAYGVTRTSSVGAYQYVPTGLSSVSIGGNLKMSGNLKIK